jgi:hypothetical protein
MLHTIVTSALLAQLVTFNLLPQQAILAEHNMRLDTRYPVAQVNEVFKKNILLTLNYISGRKNTDGPVNWDNLEQNTEVQFTLNPGETFAFHDGVLPKYSGSVVKTTGAHFNGQDGFLSDGYLMGDGVCHLASLINWTARDAGLLVESPTSHDFANIPEVPKIYGSSIYYTPGNSSNSQLQNLYVTNNLDYSVVFKFHYHQDSLNLSVLKNI